MYRLQCRGVMSYYMYINLELEDGVPLSKEVVLVCMYMCSGAMASHSVASRTGMYYVFTSMGLKGYYV